MPTLPTWGDRSSDEDPVEFLCKIARAAWWGSDERQNYVRLRIERAIFYLHGALDETTSLTRGVGSALRELLRAEREILDAELPDRRASR